MAQALFVLFFLLFGVAVVVNLAQIISALLPYRRYNYTALSRWEQAVLYGLIGYPALPLIPAFVAFAWRWSGDTSIGGYVFLLCHMVLSAIGAAIALYLKQHDMSFKVAYYTNILLGFMYYLGVIIVVISDFLIAATSSLE